MVETTFLPKTCRLVFADRLQARSDKGRVFLSGAPTYDPLVVVNSAEWKDTNIYEIGQEIQGRTATYSGGSANTVYRSRIQTRKTPQDSWVNGPWTTHDNSFQFIDRTLTTYGQCRFMTQARDDQAGVWRAVDQVNSFAPIRDVPALEFGTITATVKGNSYDYADSTPVTVTLNEQVALAVNWFGGTADPTVSWSTRSGSNVTLSGIDPNTLTCTATCTASGLHTVTATLIDSNTEEYSTSVVFELFVP